MFFFNRTFRGMTETFKNVWMKKLIEKKSYFKFTQQKEGVKFVMKSLSGNVVSQHVL